MARPTTLSGAKVIVQIYDAGSSAYIAPCGLTTKTFTFSATTNESIVPDCDDPSLPAWIERDVNALSMTVSGSGILAMESLADWWDFFEDGVAIACRIVVDIAGSSGGGYWAGDFILSSFGVTGERGSKATVEVELVSDGVVTFTPGS